MSNPTSSFGWIMPTASDLVTDLPADFEVFGQAVDTSLADLKGGTTGQVLAKASGTDMDFTWVAQDDSDAIQNALLTTTGDTIYASGASTPARLGIGTTGQILTVAGGVPTWASPAGGGKVLQVVMGTTGTATTASSSTYIDSTLTANITPSSASSKVLVLVAQNGCVKSAGSAANGIGLRLYRGASNLITFAYEGLQTDTTIVNKGSFPVMYLDTPATTSETTYKTQMANTGSNAASVTTQQNATSTIILMEIGA